MRKITVLLIKFLFLLLVTIFIGSHITPLPSNYVGAQSYQISSSNVLTEPSSDEYMKGRVLIKLSPKVRILDITLQYAWTEDPSLNRTLVVQGIQELKPVFPHARPPGPGEFVDLLSGKRVPKPDLTRWFIATLPEDAEVMAVVEKLSKVKGIDKVEPDYLRNLTGDIQKQSRKKDYSSLKGKIFTAQLPGPGTDPLYSEQWHLAAAGIPDAWAYLDGKGLSPGGNRDIVVAVIDTGVDYTHSDLAANMWTNSLEIPDNSTDDDGNGYVDDVHGADVIENSGDPMDDHGHGTHVAGIIAAQAGNSLGGVGVAYNVQLMALKAAQYSGYLASSDIAEAIYYAVAQGADVINMSFGGYSRSQVEEDALVVAFSQAVLVAAAGNDNKVNSPCPLAKDMYPAAYNWVLGVMASTQSATLASFSNYDCTPHDTHEYELMAPGVDVWSTFPNDNYAAWDGTSMSAPIVSGIAALVRTEYANKNDYSSRFIMGQIVSNASPVSNAYDALTVVPEPELRYLEHKVFDKTDLSPENDEDGIVDSGETIDLGIVIRNHWGKAEQVEVKLEARAEGAVDPDPYVTMVIDTVDYGAIGSFNQDDNGLIYDDGVAVGVNHPFRFLLDSTTPNNHVIPFRVTATAYNGLDPGDLTLYTFVSYFNVTVQKGFEVYGEISENTTWTADKLYIVTANTYVPAGVILTIEPGTTVAFEDGTYLLIRGNLSAMGTKDKRITFTSNSLSPHDDSWDSISLLDSAEVTLTYCDISYPRYGINLYSIGELLFTVTHSKITNCSRPIHIWDTHHFASGAIHIEHNKFENSKHSVDINYGNVGTITIINNLFNNLGYYEYGALCLYYMTNDVNYEISGNTFLDNKFDVDVSYGDIDFIIDMTDNYWGTTDELEISASIYDYYDTFDRAKVNFKPYLNEPSPEALPILSDISINPPSPLSVGTAEFTLTFSTDMDTSVEPTVAFGPDEPYTDHRLSGSWADSRTWVGTYTITPLTGDGWHTISVDNAREVSHWMEITNDYSHRFEVITVGTEAMNLQATGHEGYVDLSWKQDEFDLLAGFNIYRSTSEDGQYSRINTTLIPPEQRSYKDEDVEPGQTYFYKFTVVKTDSKESDYSNVAKGTPLDTIPPEIMHTPLTQAPPGLDLTISADVTDNVAVQEVKLYYRPIGKTAYLSLPMVKTTGDRYSATIDGSEVVSPGLEYYIEAKDEVNTVSDGRPEYPWQVSVTDKPVVTAVTPDHGPASGGTSVTIAGSNFKPGATATFGGEVASDVTVVSSSQITCTTPPHYPAVVDVTVENSDGQSGTLLRGFTYESEVASLSLPDTGGKEHDIVQVPVNAANIQGLAAADLTATFDNSVLSARGASTGSLTPGWSIEANTNTAGKIQISMASPSGTVTGSGVLTKIEFEVIGSHGQTSPLHIESVSFNGGAIQVQTEDGSFAVEQVHDVSGRVGYWKDSTGVRGVELTLEDDRVYTGVSEEDGTYTVSGAPEDDYILTPTKSDDVNGISAYDASLVLQRAADLITLSRSAATAADVDKSTVIDSMDAFYILQKAVDLISLPFPGAGVVWQFDPENYTYTNLSNNLTNQDFTAILLGEVSGNWTKPPESQSRIGLASDQVVVRIQLEPASADGKTVARIWLNPKNNDVYSLQMALSFDKTKATPISAEKGSIVNEWLLASNLNYPGKVLLALAGARPVAEAGTILTLSFQLSNSDQNINLLPIRCEVDETSVPVEVTPIISGCVKDVGDEGIEGVTITFSNEGGTTTTASDGNYTQAVPFGWSGTATPSKAGYTFSPSSISYSDVTSNQLNNDYTATLLTYTISGTVTTGETSSKMKVAGGSNGVMISGLPRKQQNDKVSIASSSGKVMTQAGLSGVVMDGLPGSPTTDADGNYSATVEYGWSGTVTPTKTRYTFSPPSRTYPNVTSDQVSQDYTATVVTPTISGCVKDVGDEGIEGVTITFSNEGGTTTTDSNGNYTQTVPFGWSGTATPSKAGYVFDPTHRDYSNITSDFTGEDYTGTMLPSYTLNIYTATGSPAPGEGGTTDPLPGDHPHFAGDSVQTKAIPNIDYRFSKWTGDASDSDIFNEEITILIDRDKSITANFCTKCGDTNGDLSITPGDAQEAFEIYLVKIPNPTECQKENADVNCDGTKTEPKVTPEDALAIFEKYLGKNELPSDCSGGSRIGTVLIQRRPSPGVNLFINDIEVTRGEEIFIPIIIDNPINIDAFGFDLIYPSQILEFVAVERMQLLKNFHQVDASEISKGVLRIGGYSSEPINSKEADIVVTVIFRVVGEPREPSIFMIINTVDDLENARVKTGMLNEKKQ